MRKKSDISNPATEIQLKRELTRLKTELTADIEKQVNKRFDVAEKMLSIEIVASTLDARQRLEKKLSEATDKILTHIDPFVKEVHDFYEERAVVGNQVSELRDRVDEHEERIAKLETGKIAA